MCSNSSVGSSSSTVSASSETHIQNGAIMPNGDDAKPKKAVGSSASSNTTSGLNTSASPSSFNYSFESYVKSNYPGAQMSPSKQDDMPVLSIAQSGTEQVAKRPRSRLAYFLQRIFISFLELKSKLHVFTLAYKSSISIVTLGSLA